MIGLVMVVRVTMMIVPILMTVLEIVTDFS